MSQPKNRKLKAVVFTDIAGFSALTQRNEPLALQYVESYRDIVTKLTNEYNGEIVHFYGDGSLSLHDSNYEAVSCAIQMQQLFRKESIPVRIGIHFGEIVRSDETIYGNAVNISSRLHNLASPSSILVSGTTASEIENHPDIDIIEVGKQRVKNISKPVTVYAVKAAGLNIPTRNEIQNRAKNRPWTQVIVTTGIGLVLLVLFLLTVLPRDFDTSERILIKPFTNLTGDTTLNKYSVIYASYITNMLIGVDDIEIVYGWDLYTNEAVRVMGISDYSLLQRFWQTRNFIVGEYDYAGDGQIAVRCALVDGNNGDLIVQFPEQTLPPSEYRDGLTNVTERILGFLESKENKTLAPPNQDAFGAYVSAQRVWYDDPPAARDFLLKAIEYDSTFIDAFFLLADYYHNRAKPIIADSVIEVASRRFPIENQDSRRKDYFYYFKALYSGDNEAAFKYIMNEFERDPRQKFTNTSAAAHALYYVNAPRECLGILNKIPWQDVDYEQYWDIMRLDMGIISYCDLGKYKRADRLLKYYPQQRIGLSEYKLMLRVFAGLGDTARTEELIRRIELNYDTSDMISALHWTSQQFRVLGKPELTELYAIRAMTLMDEAGFRSRPYTELSYEMGNYRRGLDQILQSYSEHPDYALFTYLTGKGYAHLGMKDSTNYFLRRLDQLDSLSKWPYRGWISYMQACIYSAQGDHESALIKLEHAVHSGLEFRVYMMNWDPALIPIHNYDRFTDITHPLKN